MNEAQRKRFAKYLGSIKSEKKAESSRRNGKMGGRPKGVASHGGSQKKNSGCVKGAVIEKWTMTA